MSNGFKQYEKDMKKALKWWLNKRKNWVKLGCGPNYDFKKGVDGNYIHDPYSMDVILMQYLKLTPDVDIVAHYGLDDQ